MGLLSQSRSFFTYEQAAEYLSKELNEKVLVSDFLQLVIDQKITKAVRVMTRVEGNVGEKISNTDYYDLCNFRKIIADELGISENSDKPDSNTQIQNISDRIKIDYPFRAIQLEECELDYMLERSYYHIGLLVNDEERNKIISLKESYFKTQKILPPHSTKKIFNKDEILLFYLDECRFLMVEAGIYDAWELNDEHKNIASYLYADWIHKGEYDDTYLKYPSNIFIRVEDNIVSMRKKTRHALNAHDDKSVEDCLSNFVLGFRKETLDKFIENLNPPEIKLETRQQKSLAKTIMSLAIKANIDLSVPTRAAKEIEKFGDTKGLDMPSWQTILKWIEITNSNQD